RVRALSQARPAEVRGPALHDRGDVLLVGLDRGEADLLDLRSEARPADDEDHCPGGELVRQQTRGDLRGGHELLRLRRDADHAEVLGGLLRGAGGVVRREHDGATRVPGGLDGLRSVRDRLGAMHERAVEVEQQRVIQVQQARIGTADHADSSWRSSVRAGCESPASSVTAGSSASAVLPTVSLSTSTSDGSAAASSASASSAVSFSSAGSTSTGSSASAGSSSSANSSSTWSSSSACSSSASAYGSKASSTEICSSLSHAGSSAGAGAGRPSR